jgi:hypothetical protein
LCRAPAQHSVVVTASLGLTGEVRDSPGSHSVGEFGWSGITKPRRTSSLPTSTRHSEV